MGFSVVSAHATSGKLATTVGVSRAHHPASVKAHKPGVTAALPRDWRLGFVSQEDEYITPAKLEPLHGTLPADLNGTFLRNGPGRLDVYGERLSHWFDGDGKIAKIDIQNGQATFQSRFVETARKRREDEAQQRLYQGFALTPRYGLWGKLKGYGDMNNANTNVIVQAGKLLALQEGGLPHRLDLGTLATVGPDNLQGLPDGARYTAHPKPQGDGMWGFAVTYGMHNRVQTYYTDAAGVTSAKGVWEMPFPGLVHDFSITETKAVFVMPPWTMDPFPWRFLLGLDSMDKLLTWTPELGARVITMDLATGATTQARVEPALLFHTVNAWDNQGGGLTLDVCSMPDGNGLQVALDVMQGKAPQRNMPTVQRLRLDADGQVVENRRLFDTTMDFPRVAPMALHHPHTHLWGVSWPEGKSFYGQPVHINLATGQVDAAPMGVEEYANECALAPKAGGKQEDDAYLMTVVLNAAEQRNELRVYDAGRLSAGAICSYELPQLFPLGFHGNWLPRGASQAVV